MKASFVAGFGPVVRDTDASQAFWRPGLGIELNDPGYFGTDKLDGVKAFAMWPLTQAAESTFGSNTWPAEIPAPQAWMKTDAS